MNFTSLPWWLSAIIIIAVGYGLARLWMKLFQINPEKRVRNPWKATLSFWGRTVFQVGSVIIALTLVPWATMTVSESIVVGGSLVLGLLVARLDHLLAALTGGFGLARIGEIIEIDGMIMEIEDKGLMRLSGSTPNGKNVSIGYADLTKGSLVNWTRTPFARKLIDVHVSDPNFDIDKVYEAIDSVLKPNGKHNPDYSINTDDMQRFAFRGYAGQEPNSNLVKVGIFSRYISDMPALELKVKEEILRACEKRGIELGQVGHLYMDGGKIESVAQAQKEPVYEELADCA